MIKLSEYYSEKTSLYEDVENLVIINENNRDEINVLVLNIVLKYLTSYLDIQETSIENIKLRVQEILNADLWILSNLSNEENTIRTIERFLLDCLLDIRQTSAIFKEISFDKSFEETNAFNWLDLWSWSWILTLAMYVSALRNWASEWNIYYVDQSVKWVNKTTEILNWLWWKFNFSGRVSDILDRDTYNDIPLDNLSYLVSETISNTTPSFSIDPEDGELTLFSELDEYMLQIMLQWDPYPSIISTVTGLSPELYQNIKNTKLIL